MRRREYPKAAGVDEFIQRAKPGADSDADLFVGLNTPETVRVDEQRPDQQLFDDVSSEVEGTGDLKEFLRVDPGGRAVADDTEYIWVVYDGTEVENDVRVLDDWQPAYNAFLNDERPVVVSYSTDQVSHHEEDQLPHHQVGFLNDEGDAYEPPNPVTFTYDEPTGNVEGWTESWAQQVASN
jgi:thiamine transport system substrate-binding protein